MNYNEQLSLDYSDIKSKYAELKRIALYQEEQIRELKKILQEERQKKANVEYTAYTAQLEGLLVQNGLMKQKDRLANKKYVTEKSYKKLREMLEDFVSKYWEVKEELDRMKGIKTTSKHPEKFILP